MFQDIGERMTKNPTELPPPSMKIKVVAPPESQYSVRIGGSILLYLHIFFFGHKRNKDTVVIHLPSKLSYRGSCDKTSARDGVSPPV